MHEDDSIHVHVENHTYCVSRVAVSLPLPILIPHFNIVLCPNNFATSALFFPKFKICVTLLYCLELTGIIFM